MFVVKKSDLKLKHNPKKKKKLAYFCVLKIEVRRNASTNYNLCIFNFVLVLQFLKQQYML